MPHQNSHSRITLPGYSLLLALMLLVGCGRGGPPLTPAQVEAVRGACIGGNLLRLAEETTRFADQLEASRRSLLEEAEARLSEADAAHRAIRAQIGEPASTSEALELQARFDRSQNRLRDARSDAEYARRQWQQADAEARESGAYLELVALHAAALAYADSAANFAGSAEDSLRYAGLAAAKQEEARQVGRTHRGLEARFSAEYAEAEADQFSTCNLQAEELLEQGRSS
ncbi:MAG: hypothetical protein JSV86_05105 [Gemmatimonadota bacterium]|nr:MAG: hypothetical protein JSV86_05105 [Gemmatimonadota bacterium]